ncbi:hypothetical protein ACFFX0_12485 [Citricoccus parietis]|uniref:Uncharacterized protein n=1 Tax=Citricoccus parietis TaxID=592307 RepID=A0ABV5FZ82_9MICC
MTCPPRCTATSDGRSGPDIPASTISDGRRSVGLTRDRSASLARKLLA